MNVKGKVTAVAPATNDAERIIATGEPYAAVIQIEGTSEMLFHRWNVNAVQSKADAAKGSTAKKTDDLESYVYRDENGVLCIPSEYFRGSLITAAKFKQDPRSPRKSAMDLFKAGIVTLEALCSLGVKDWNHVDKRRVMIQRNGITRARPAFSKGWRCEVMMQVMTPEYISPELLNETVQMAGRLVGVGDFRPTFGRYMVTGFQVS